MEHRYDETDIERDGVAIHVRIDEEGTGRKPAVILMHGMMGDSGYDGGSLLQQLAEKLAVAGFKAVRFDFNGHGRSGGEFANADVFNETEDALAVLRYVEAMDDVDGVYLLGHSLGGVIAGIVAGLENERIKGLVMLAPAANIKNDALKGELLGVAYDPVRIPDDIELDGGKASVDGKFVRINRMLPVYEAAALFKGQALAIQGKHDQVLKTPVVKNYEKAMARCTASVFEDLTHAFDGMDRQLALNEAVQFLAGLKD